MAVNPPHPFSSIALAQRQARAGDPFRPLTHFVAPAAWLNDPNGLTFWQGEYHLFYQHNPYRPADGRKFWGHAASQDLLHWRDLPVALTPGAMHSTLSIYEPGQVERQADFTRIPRAVPPDEVDSEGAWSGCAVDDQGVPILVYTARPGLPEWVCLATSRDGMLTWQKETANPVLAAPPAGLQTSGFRDPYVWREGEDWKMVVGSGTEKGAMVLLYNSPDLRAWNYMGPLLEGEASRNGVMWECPNFFPLDGKHVLIVSEMNRLIVRYFVGRYDGQRLRVESEGQVDWGKDFYAPQTFADPKGRRILFGWSWEGRSEAAQLAAGWAGVLTLPRTLSLGPDGLLCSAPAPEVEKLRGTEFRLDAQGLQVGETRLPLQGNCLEIQAEFEPGAGACGLKVLVSPDGAEETLIGYRSMPDGGRVYVDRMHASLSPDTARDVYEGPLALAHGEPLKLHVYIDRSILEVYANERACLTTRVYPYSRASTGVILFAESPARLLSLKAWPQEPVWPFRP